MEYALYLGWEPEFRREGMIFLRKVGPRLFFRDGSVPQMGAEGTDYRLQYAMDVPDYRILVDRFSHPSVRCRSYRNLAVYVPQTVTFLLQNVPRVDLWDHR